MSGIAVRPADRAFLRLHGEEARRFLQGLITVDVDTLDSRMRYGALLTPQGRLLFDFFLWAEGPQTLLLETLAARRDALSKRLLLFRLRARVDIAPETGRAVLLLPGADPAAFGLPVEAGALRRLGGGGLVAVDPREPRLGIRAVLPEDRIPDFLSAHGLREAEEAAWHRHRLALGVPEGEAELGFERTFALEADFDALGAVDFGKGCYVGQEVTARMHFRTRPKRRLLPVRIRGTVEPPAPVTDATGREAGELRSRHGDLGMALLRLETLTRQDSHPLRAGEAELEPFWPDWLERQEKNPLQPAREGL